MKLLLLAAILAQATLWADGGTVQLREQAGDLVITLFTAPSPLSVGTVDLSLLLQGRNGLEPVLDADVLVSLREKESGIEFHAHATSEQARNRLLYAAPVMFPKAGQWEIAIAVKRNGQETDVAGILDVAAAHHHAVSYAGYIAFPPIMIVLFVVRERLIRRRSKG